MSFADDLGTAAKSRLMRPVTKLKKKAGKIKQRAQQAKSAYNTVSSGIQSAYASSKKRMSGFPQRSKTSTPSYSS